MYEVKYSKKAEKEYNKLPKNIRDRIDKKIKYLKLTPRGTDTKKLSGQKNAYRTKVGTYRVVYEIEDDKLIVWIIKVGPRKDIYKKS